MNTIENGTSDSDTKSRYVMLRRLFLLGYGMNIVLWFVPAVRMKVGGFLGFGGEDTVLSMFSVVRMISNVSPGWTAFWVVVFASNIVFIVLALKYPRRWVFLTASSVAAFFVLWGLFSSSHEQVEYFLIPRVLGYIASMLTLTGFFIKPPVVQV